MSHPPIGHAAVRRTEVNRRFFEAEAERIARLCHRVAKRFAGGGRLIALGESPADRSDARHVAVEFVHPVIVGKRALPALALTADAGALTLQTELVARPADIVIGFGEGRREGEAGEAPGSEHPGRRTGDFSLALALCRERGCLTVAFDPTVGAEWTFRPDVADPFIRQEVVETLYHVLWELVHVFFEHRGLLEARPADRGPDVGDSAFLYPFLGRAETDLDAVMDDVRASVRMKAEEVGALRERTLDEGEAALLEAAATLRRAFDGGGTLLAFGNGGSATDAMDVVADFRSAPGRGPGGREWRPRRALDLTEDPGILTAICNDVGTDASFSRQVIAYGLPGDVALGISTSGSSRNVVQALEEARRRGLHTMALVGYDGGRILEERLADHVIVSPSEYIPRIQEAQATVYHLLRELVEREA